MKSVRFAKSDDGTSLAWTRSGTGLALVKAANWITHLEYDDESPIWSHWVDFLEQNFDYVRFDERGCGLSDTDLRNVGPEKWIEDIAAVVEASKITKPFYLLGISQGAATAIAYAARYPENVAGLILIGGYARGEARRGNPGERELIEGMAQVFRHGWSQDNPVFKDVYTASFVPGGNEKQRRWFHDLLDKSITPDVGADLLLARAEVDVTDILDQVTVPTLIVHLRNDKVCPLSESEFLARHISGAEFLILDGDRHIIQLSDPGWVPMCNAINSFCGIDSAPTVANLTARENDVLRLICVAKSNKEIANELEVTEKTVRNHATNLFAKIGVNNRQEAIVKMAGNF
jgi:pimeloyl-ACP methyl ester carboxylesterase/DNA-binding CsgD family transcriptional regulator